MTSRRHLLGGAALLLIGVTAGAGSAAGSSAERLTASAPPGVSDDTIRLGTTLPISGTAALAGQGLLAGIELAVEEANEAGGINGRELELVALDDTFDIPRNVANMRRLVEEDEVYAIVSPAGSQALPGSWELIEETNTIVWGPVSPADPQLPSVFILGPSRTEQLQIGFDYMVEQGVTKIALIGQDNELGAEGEAAVENGMAVHPDVELVASEKVEPRSQDVASAVLNVRDAGAEGLLLATDNTQAALILQQVESLGMDIIVISDNGAGGTGGPNMVDAAGDAAEGFIGGLQVALPTSEEPAVVAWRELAEASGKEQATSNFSLQTYSYTKGFLDILTALGDDLSYESFIAAAESTPIETNGLSPNIECGPLPDGHSCAAGAALAQYSDGEWTVIRDFGPPAS
jgi:branched-chain amino acid transport system substrate-binding protein